METRRNLMGKPTSKGIFYLYYSQKGMCECAGRMKAEMGRPANLRRRIEKRKKSKGKKGIFHSFFN